MQTNFQQLINAIPQLQLDQLYIVENNVVSLYEILEENNDDKDVSPIDTSDIDRLIKLPIGSSIHIGMLEFSRTEIHIVDYEAEEENCEERYFRNHSCFG